MDDNTLYTQITDIAKCINGLSLTLSEVDGGGGISKIVTDVHELIKSFRLLGKYYLSELLKKCRELETKNRELEDLSRQLQQVHHESNNSGFSTVPKPDCHFGMHQQQRREKETGADGRKCVSELSRGEGDLFECNGTDRSIFQCSKAKSELVEGSREDSTLRKGVPDGSRKETGGRKEQIENLAAENRSLSPALPKDDKHLQDLSRLESNQKGYFHFVSSKQASLYSECDHELSLLDCESIDQGTAAYTENTFHTSIKPVQKSHLLQSSIAPELSPRAHHDNPTEEVEQIRITMVHVFNVLLSGNNILAIPRGFSWREVLQLVARKGQKVCGKALVAWELRSPHLTNDSFIDSDLDESNTSRRFTPLSKARTL